MTAQGLDWIRHGKGTAPRLIWSFATEAPLVALEYARETGETLAADASGGLYHFDRLGRLLRQSHLPPPLRALAWSDTGVGGLALLGDQQLQWFDRQLTLQGTGEQPQPILDIAVEAHGRYAVATLESGRNVLYDAHRKVVRRFESLQPLTIVEFLVHRPALVAVTGLGQLCCHDFSGEPLWQQPLFANVGDMAVTGDGKTILLAGYTFGIQCHNQIGAQVGSYQLHGAVSRVSCSFRPGRIAAATVERRLYWLNAEGQILWTAEVPDEVMRLICDPTGAGVICGLQSGRVLRLDWPTAT